MRQTENYDFPAINRGDTFEEIVFEFYDVDQGTAVETPISIESFCLQAKIYANEKPSHTFEGEVFEGNKIRLFQHKVTLGARIYQYDLQITETDGITFTWIKGTFTVKQDISECQ